MQSVVLATGNAGLDDALSKALAKMGVQVVGDPIYYREGLLTGDAAAKAGVAVLSSALGGSKPLRDVIYDLRKRNVRVVLLCGNAEDNLALVKQAVRMGVYDIVIDPVRLRDVVERVEHPATFADVAGKFALDDIPEDNGEDDPLDQVFSLGEAGKPPGNSGHGTQKKSEVVFRDRVVVQEQPIVQDVSGVLTVMSSGGGNGKSTVAIHVACAAAANGFRPILVECDEEKACHLQAFGLQDSYKGQGLESLKEADFADMARLQRRLQDIAVTTAMGVTLLPVSAPHIDLPITSHEDMTTLMSVLARWGYRPVIVDATCRLKDATTLGAALHAHRVILVVEPLMPAARSVAVLHRDLLDIGVAPEAVTLVINKADKSTTLKSPFIEEAVGLGAAALIPADPTRYNAVFNSGKISLDGGAPWQQLMGSFMSRTVLELPRQTPARKAKWPFSWFGKGGYQVN